MPFIAKPDNLKVGLNNLGNRNAAERLFTMLLPGMNNVSQRIRYYSFYSWLLMNFYIGEKEAKTTEFRNYIRSAEYLLALIHAYNDDIRGIPGITTAITATEEKKEIFSIRDGIEGNGIRMYWKYTNGILGQYYVVALSDMNLIGFNEHSNVFYNVTKGEAPFITGEKLAKCFSDSIGESAERFIQCVKQGWASVEDLKFLYITFNMHNTSLFPQENKMLINILVEDDYPADEESSLKTSYRRDTIKYFLSYVQMSKDSSEQGFARYMYEEYVAGKIDDETSVRWHAYYLSDQWQFNCTSIFSRLLNLLREKGTWTAMDEISGQLASEIINKLAWDETETLEEVLGNNASDEIIIRPNAAEAFLNLIRLAAVNIDGMEEVKNRCKISEQSTFSTFCNYISKHKADPIADFIKAFIEEHIIYRHYIVSFIKQQTTGISSQKFILENDSMLFVAPYDATHTAPRIATLANFLTDLGLIDKEGIKEDGVKLLNTLVK